ncbi:MAG: TetR family transcriptional regulator [Actinophytocola sp.]|uniref:TetR/AcrR family transcriptional regulator n=1 Tax=Actinophytocola sp. TaxID=1872138 RepID=UPI0013246712|nr:TetR/AcrR family transcriptional regulator [Actinophytocola sp.]MPZ79094.1 TetR family transcriptional regulator [Actinophytocola sp.]
MDRRQQYREQTRQEAKRIALEQLAEDGIAGISVNAIGKRMGITGPALYRYFANRDALLTELISDGYHDLADALDAAVGTAKSPAARLRAVAHAMRAWAVAAPHRYLLLFGTPVPGYKAPEYTLAAANRAMTTLLAAVGEDTAQPRRSTFYKQLAAWGERMGHGSLTPRQQHWGLTVWTRLHGVLSLEVANQFALSGIDPELLYKAEVEALIAWWAPES